MIANSNDEMNFPYKLLLTGSFVKAFSNTSSTNVTLTKTQLSTIVQSRG